jgi:hypothetical protein
MNTEKMILQQVSDVAWLVNQGNTRIGLLNKDVQEHYTFISGKNLVNFTNQTEVVKHFGNAKLFEEQITSPVTISGKCYIKGYEVKYENPYVLERSHPDFRDNLPLYSKIEGNPVYYAAGYYCVNFEKAWKCVNCPKVSTLDKYGYEGPFKDVTEARKRMRELNKKFKNA